MLLISIGALAQPPKGGKLLVDETWYVPSGATGNFRIVCCNDSIQKMLLDKFSTRSYRITAQRKEDRIGKYWEVSIYFRKEEYNDVISFIKKL